MNANFKGAHVAMSPHAFHISKLAIVTFSVLFMGYYLFSRPEITQQDYHEIYRVAVSGKKAVFVEAVLGTEIDGPIDNSALKELCKRKIWTPGLIFSCEAPQGGVGNVRNVFLNCVRYAIEAGGESALSPPTSARLVLITSKATAFVVSEIVSRGTTLETLHTNINVPFTYLFDLEHFKASLSESCPQIHLIPHLNDLWDKPSTAKAIVLSPQDLTTHFEADTVLAHPANWTQSFKKYLNASHPTPFSASLPVLVSLHTPLLQFPLSYDDPSFVANFGKILRFREDIRRLAGTTLYAMNKKHGIGMDPDLVGVHPGLFYGAHLRTAADAKAAGWTPYINQSVNYLSHANQHKLPVIYLTTGNEADAKRFTEDAASFNMSVSTKEELLAEKGFERELKEMKALTWDQRGLIDYEVLLRSSLFGGTHESSFSWNVAMRRHVVTGGGTWTTIEDRSKLLPNKNRKEKELSKREETGKEVPGLSGNFLAPQSFKDELSVVFGPPDEGKMFELSMWP
jgi:hypothetical protein